MFTALVLPGGIAGLGILAILILAVIAIVFIAAKAMGVAIPQWAVQVFWVIVIAIVCILAIRLVAGI